MSQVEDRRTVEKIRTRYAEMDGQPGADVRFLLSVIDDIIGVLARLNPEGQPAPASTHTRRSSELSIRMRYRKPDSDVGADVLFVLSAIDRIRVVLEPFQPRAPQYLRAAQDAADASSDQVARAVAALDGAIAVDEWIANSPQRSAGWEPPPRPGGIERQIGL